jgi:hypothetical protein
MSAPALSNPPQKRLVVLAGPHKSASTSTQYFFLRRASDEPKSRRKEAFQNWTWPWFNTTHLRHQVPDKVLSLIVTRHDEEDRRDEILRFLADLWKRDPSNLIIGTEEFDRFGETPWTGRDGIRPIEEILEFLPVDPEKLEIVVMYRTPRYLHWLSIWKQITTGKTSYHDFICPSGRTKDAFPRVWEGLATAANPMGLVEVLRNKNWNVVLIDMGGVEQKGLDISHTVACDVLQVPCKNGMVEGVMVQVRANQRSKRDPNITLEHKIEIERLLRLRDCAYAPQLESDPGVHVLHRHSLWQNCSDTESNAKYKNTTFLLSMLQHLAGCQENDRNFRENPLSPYHGQDSEDSDMLAITFRLQQCLLLATGLLLSRQIRLRRRRLINRRRGSTTCPH